MSNQENLLRVEAEAKLDGFEQVEPVRSAEALLHELQVHQIELEMQNENLRQSQIALEESRDRYADLYDFAPVGYLTLNVLGIIIEINHTGAVLLGVERKSLISRRFSQFVASADKVCWQNYLLNLLNDVGAGSCELRLQRQDGTKFYVGLCSRCIHGEVKTLRIMLTDISERKQAEEKLRESEERYHSVVSALTEGVVVHASNGEIVAWNPAAERILGRTSEQMMGRVSIESPGQTIREDGTLFPHEAHPSQEVVRTGMPQYNVIMGVYKPCGALSWVSINAVPIFNSASILPSTVVVSFTDITEFRQDRDRVFLINNELRESRQLLEAVVENIPVMVFLKRASDLRYELFNRAGEQLVGSSHSALLAACRT